MPYSINQSLHCNSNKTNYALNDIEILVLPFRKDFFFKVMNHDVFVMSAASEGLASVLTIC